MFHTNEINYEESWRNMEGLTHLTFTLKLTMKVYRKFVIFHLISKLPFIWWERGRYLFYFILSITLTYDYIMETN